MAFTAIISNGTAQRLSEGRVKNDFENLKFIKAAIKRVITLSIITPVQAEINSMGIFVAHEKHCERAETTQNSS